jgi:pilus assembly protein Flp/PilA
MSDNEISATWPTEARNALSVARGYEFCFKGQNRSTPPALPPLHQQGAPSVGLGHYWLVPVLHTGNAHYGQIWPGGIMQSLWQAFWSDESGQGLVEYALIIALVAVGLIAILLVLRNSIGNVFNNAATQLNNAPTNPYP